MQAEASVAAHAGRALAFGPFSFDRTSRLLWKSGVEVPLPPRVLGVLALLLDRRGDLVTKQELMAAVWRDAFVTETSLAEAISVLRQTLGDDPQRPTYIQTLHRRGYRFIAAVQEETARRVSEAVAAAATLPLEHREPRLWLLVPWIVTLFALLTAGSALWQFLERPAPAASRPVRFTLDLPAGLSIAAAGGSVAVSQDGALMAVAACDAVRCGIYLRPLAQDGPTFIAGTAGGAAPFFSPDGRSLGYFARGRLYTIALAGGSPVAVADAPEPLGAAWLHDGRIVFARSTGEGLFLVGDQGGPVEALTTPARDEGGHRWPAAVGEGDALVFTVDADRDYAAAVSLRTRAWRRLADEVTSARVPLPGYLLAQRGADLVAGPIDGRTLSMSGLPVPVAEMASASAGPQFAMSATGTLAIASPGSAAVHVVLDWAGELRRLVPPPQPVLPR